MRHLIRSGSLIVTNLKKYSLITLAKKFHDEFSSTKIKENEKEHTISGTVASKYNIFSDADSPVILDVDEERLKYNKQIIDILPLRDTMEGINLERGINGVFEIKDLVDLLKRENANNIFVCRVSKDIKYVDHMCIVTGMSKRHINAMAQFVRKVFKHKRNSDDILPKIEGELSKDWVALDLGNIALHIFSNEARKIYDLESLWSVGPQYDKECNKPEQAIVDLYQRHSVYLSDLKPKEQKKDLG